MSEVGSRAAQIDIGVIGGGDHHSEFQTAAALVILGLDASRTGPASTRPSTTDVTS